MFGLPRGTWQLIAHCLDVDFNRSERLYRGQKIVPNLLPKVRLDIACNDEFVDVAIEAILRSAKHGDGRIGDGKIFVTELKRCIRIRTNEGGCQAI
ncbi:MAG: P-II family nitrogen regulator [Deltaproteobacteria bacterium]|nr:P-II family nitrogen regulator [Candidatus Tharpella sp.]